MRHKLVMGFDPGIGTTGYAVVSDENPPRLVAGGVVFTSRGSSTAERLKELYEEVLVLIDRYSPDEIAVEKLFFGRNTTTAVSVSEARGVILLASAEKGKKVYEYSPVEVKKVVSGYGKASKGQVRRAVAFVFGLDKPPSPDDTADAVAVALCHILSNRFLTSSG